VKGYDSFNPSVTEFMNFDQNSSQTFFSGIVSLVLYGLFWYFVGQEFVSMIHRDDPTIESIKMPLKTDNV